MAKTRLKLKLLIKINITKFCVSIITVLCELSRIYKPFASIVFEFVVSMYIVD